jgi:hypothetical protein
MGFIPRIKPSLLAKVFALVYEHVACVAQGRDPVVVSLEAHALAIALLVGMGGYNRPILSPASLTRALPDKVKQFPIPVHLACL